MIIAKIPMQIQPLPQWIPWRYEERNGKPTKVPYNPHFINDKASTTNPKTWGTLDEALDALGRGNFDGIGFVFTEECGIVGIDLDHVVDERGVIAQGALDLMSQFPSYKEYSPSGTGFHILVYGSLPGKGINKSGVEMYGTERFFTLTTERFGNHADITPCQEQIDKLYKTHATPEPTPKQLSNIIDLKPRVDIDRKIEELLQDHYFKQLWDKTVGHKSQSEYDLAICNKAKQAGLSADEAWAVVKAHQKRWDIDPKKSEREDYKRRTLMIAAEIPPVITNADDGYFVDAAKITHEPKKITWLIKQYFPRGGIIWMAGEWSTFKTFNALSIAYHIALGRDWCGCRTVKGNVVYIAGEGFSGLGKRLRGLELYHGEVLPDGIIQMANAAVFLNDTAQMSRLINNILHVFHGEPPAMIIVDTKSANMEGSDSDPALMNTWINNVRQLERELDCTVLVIDHVGHMAKDRPRGVSQQMGAADAVYMLTRDEELDTVVMRTEKDPKDFESPPELTFKATTQELPEDWNDEDGETVTTLVLHPIQNVEIPSFTKEPERKGIGKQQRQALDILHASYVTARTNLTASDRDPRLARVDLAGWKNDCKKAGMDRKRITDACDTLIDRELVLLDGATVIMRDKI